MKNLIPALLVVVAAFGAGCGASLQDCEALARDQPDCMGEQAIAECNAENAACEENGGEVLQLESCPLQFVCSQRPGT
ncbi:MAG TPA: hypothetical protein VGF99_18880 [Myxococcota bacterium]